MVAKYQAVLETIIQQVPERSLFSGTLGGVSLMTTRTGFCGAGHGYFSVKPYGRAITLPAF
jgi:hypothetical protein